MTIKARVGLTMAFLGALLLVVGVLGLSGMGSSNDATLDIYTNQMPSALAIQNAEIFAARERLALDRAAFQAGTPGSAAGIDRAREMRAASDTWWKKYLDVPRDANEDRLAQDVSAKREALHQQFAPFVDAIQANDHDRIIAGANALQAAYNALSKSDASLSELQLQQSRKAYESAQSRYGTFRMVTLAAIVAGLIAALVAYLNLRAAIARPLAEALDHFEAISGGDLRRTIVVRSRDEMGLLLEGLAKMQRSLLDTVRTVRTGSESIASATKQIAAGNLDLSSRTEEQASSLQETASSMDELTSTVRQNADNARQASALAANASEIANKGNAVVNQVVGTMGEINQSSARIADIITIIEGIAFQTNILALNAAVEAARAGEEGRGFAVVAGEVRSLAQRSSNAAKEIKALIDTSVERVRTGSTLVDEAGGTMKEIIAAVQRVTDIMGEIAAASEEQSAGINNVARAVSQMDEVTQQNAALVEEASAAAQSLEDQAARLRTAVGVFRLLDDGAASPVAPIARPRANTRTVPVRKEAQPARRAALKAPAAEPVAMKSVPAQSARPVAAKAATSPKAAAPSVAPAPAIKPAAKAVLSAAAAQSSSGSDDDWETF
jgi:methyl-accepting chemotaxis protein-1 (serine sensor receptor)